MSDLNRIRRVSPRLQAFCGVVIIGFLAGHVLEWTVPEAAQFFDSGRFRDSLAGIGPLSPIQSLIGLAASSGPTVLLCLAFWHLHGLFGEYAQGAVFSGEAVRRLARFGWAMALVAPAQILTVPLVSVAVTIFNPPGHRELMLYADPYDVVVLLLGGATIVIAWVMGEARRIELDHREIV